MFEIITLGGANVDTHIKANCAIQKEDSNPSSLKVSAGGVVRNIAENLALLGHKPLFLGAIGSDSNGNFLVKHSSECGIDMSQVYVSAESPTSCYIDFLQPDGEMYVAANVMDIVNEISEDYINSKSKVINSSKAFVLDTNLSEDILNYALKLSNNTKIFVDGTSAIKVVKLKSLLNNIFLIKVNRDELAALSEYNIYNEEDIKHASDLLLQKGLYSICVSLGSKGCYYADKDGKSFFKALAPAENVNNVTGCGDALMAGLIHAYLKGKSKEDMILTGLVCGKITAMSDETINNNLSDDSIEKELKNEL